MSFSVSGAGLHIAIGKGVVFVIDDGGEGQEIVLTQDSLVTHIGIVFLIVKTMIYLPASYLCNYRRWGARQKADKKQAPTFLLLDNADLCQYFLSVTCAT